MRDLSLPGHCIHSLAGLGNSGRICGRSRDNLPCSQLRARGLRVEVEALDVRITAGPKRASGMCGSLQN